MPHFPYLSRITLVIALLSLSQTATAMPPAGQYPPCGSEPTRSDIGAAMGAYQAGHVSFEEADYDRALLYWEDAFRRDCTAVKLLLSLARAYELSNNKPAAVLALRTYLERAPDSENFHSATKRIAKLESLIVEAERKEVAPPEKVKTVPQPPAEAPVEPPSARTSATKKQIWPIFVTGGGVALAVVGHIIIPSGRQAAIDLGCDLETNTCPTDDATQEAKDAEKKAHRIGIPLAIAGHAIGVAGGVLWYYLWTQSPENHAMIQETPLRPIVSPTYQGFEFRTSF